MVAQLQVFDGIKEPGAFRAGFNGTLVSPKHTIDDYTATSGQMLQWLHQ